MKFSATDCAQPHLPAAMRFIMKGQLHMHPTFFAPHWNVRYPMDTMKTTVTPS